MKREIKFRFWNKKFKQWIDGEFPLIDGVFDFSTDIYEVTQFTGLKDKNGKEIYEGDIVEVQNLPCQIQKMRVICSVEFEWAAWVAIVRKVVVWDGYTKGVEAPDMFFFSSMIDTREFRVIGNIYENPELVEDDKCAK